MSVTDQIDPRYRSLLQKAARRGYLNLVLTLSTYISLAGSNAKRWFKQEVTVTTFRACWPLGITIHFTRRFASKVATLVNTTRSVKNQDAAGLGAMAYALSKGDRTVLSASRWDREVTLMVSAIERPDDFWSWIEVQDQSGRTAAIRRLKNSGSPFDHAVIQAAAYLATNSDPPEIYRTAPGDDRFPYWVVFDHHLPQGRDTLVRISKDLQMSLSQIKWMLFYFEGSRTQKRLESVWWDRYCSWRFKKAGMVPEQAHLMWPTAKSQLKAALSEDAHQLHRDIYRWKKAHLAEVNKMRVEVGSFFSSFDRIDRRQRPLF